MARDTRTFGFNREDAIELVSLIGNADTVVAEGIPRDNGPALFRCHEDGLPGTTTAGEWESADCMLLRSDGTAISEKTVYNPSDQEIVGSSVFIAVNIAGKWFACAPGGGPLPAFFWLTENAETNQEVQAVRGSYSSPGTGDPETIISWGAESAGSGGKNLMDNAPENYLVFCPPVMSTEDNPDYQPDEEEPDFDPREKITKLIYVFAQGWCIASPPPEE